MVLADSSIWIDLFRSGLHREALARLIHANQIVQHPFLVAELALGSLRDRLLTLRDLDRLPQLHPVTLAEVRQMIEARSLYARGIGLTDAHLLASCLATPGTRLWTADLRLAAVAAELHLDYNPELP